MKPLLTYKTAAAILDCSASKVQKMVLAGEIPFIKVGNETRILPEDLEAWSATHIAVPRTRASIPDGGGVYFLLSPAIGLTKVGKAGNFRQRIPSIQSMNPEDLAISAVVPCAEAATCEFWFHRHFNRQRVRFEWFRLTSEEISWAITAWHASKVQQ